MHAKNRGAKADELAGRGRTFKLRGRGIDMGKRHIRKIRRKDQGELGLKNQQGTRKKKKEI